MEKEYFIYMHKNKQNGKMYIGQTKSLKDRWKASAYDNCTRFYNAIKCYGWDNFQHIVLQEGLTLEEANQKQTYYIQLYNTTNQNFGYNLSKGGDNKQFLSQETFQKLSNKSLQLWQQEQYRQKQHQARLKSWQNNIERKQAASQRMKQRMSNPIEKQKAKQRITGSNNPRAKKVRCIETGQIFNTIKEAENKYNNGKRSNISAVCRGIKKHALKNQKGLLLSWEYVNE